MRRPQATKLATPLHRLFPSSRAIFLYRKAVDVLRSFVRAFHPLPASVRGYHDDPVGFARFWQANLEHYLSARDADVSIRAFRYEDPVRDPRAVFHEIARWCGTPLKDLEEIIGAFAEDSQEGSNLARSSLDGRPVLALGSRDELSARIREALADHPTIREPDMILPGTWMP
jgi:hypothetical protein